MLSDLSLLSTPIAEDDSSPSGNALGGFLSGIFDAILGGMEDDVGDRDYSLLAAAAYANGSYRHIAVLEADETVQQLSFDTTLVQAVPAGPLTPLPSVAANTPVAIDIISPLTPNKVILSAPGIIGMVGQAISTSDGFALRTLDATATLPLSGVIEAIALRPKHGVLGFLLIGSISGLDDPPATAKPRAVLVGCDEADIAACPAMLQEVAPPGQAPVHTALSYYHNQVAILFSVDFGSILNITLYQERTASATAWTPDVGLGLLVPNGAAARGSVRLELTTRLGIAFAVVGYQDNTNDELRVLGSPMAGGVVPQSLTLRTLELNEAVSWASCHLDALSNATSGLVVFVSATETTTTLHVIDIQTWTSSSKRLPYQLGSLSKPVLDVICAWRSTVPTVEVRAQSTCNRILL